LGARVLKVVGLEEYPIGFTELFADHERILHINCGKEKNKCNGKFGYLTTESKEDQGANE